MYSTLFNPKFPVELVATIISKHQDLFDPVTGPACNPTVSRDFWEGRAGSHPVSHIALFETD